MTRRPRLKVLIVARHPSAGGGVVALAAEARRRRMDVEIFATGPALAHLTDRRIAGVQSFATARSRYAHLPVYRGPERITAADYSRPRRLAALVGGMSAWLTDYVTTIGVDAVIATDATEQLGPDQLIAIAATRAGVPCVRVRDGWGIGSGIETRVWRGRLPEALRREALAALYLEIDSTGVELSARSLRLPRARLRALNGLYTLDRFDAQVTHTRRRRARARLGVGVDTPLLLLFTQPTRRESAEVDFVDTLATELQRRGLDARGLVVATLEHPREADSVDGRFGPHWTAACVASRFRGRVIDLAGVVGRKNGVTFEDAMIAADVVASSYSNASIEASVLGATAAGVRAADRPIGLHVLAPASVQRTFRTSRAGLRLSPVAATHALPCAQRTQEAGRLVSQLVFSPSARERYFKQLRGRWHAGTVSGRVLNAVVSAVRTS